LYTPSIHIDETLANGLTVPKSIKINETQCSLALTRFTNSSHGFGLDFGHNRQKLATDHEKRFHCDCGVSFNNESTLIGHKKYYCRNSTDHNEVFREPQRKVFIEEKLGKSSASQLAQHVRSNHAAVQAYICQLCGYKGYSHRGIRSHLRLHELLKYFTK
uniref:C2H2-type domain-containing protein n=1 Tax=Enterobius vermicularis TaxID=51028 RepID=A0A0N4VCV2_ENTVE